MRASGAGQVTHTSNEQFDHVIRWNLYSTFWATRAALRLMQPARTGRIINMSSVEGKHGKPVLAPYVAAKHAINGLTKSLAKEVGPLGITVNAICPGLVLTEGISPRAHVSPPTWGSTSTDSSNSSPRKPPSNAPSQ
ncbi:SDR family NAD(P)-dependent oxidoreductase [Streptomyces sp. NPDC048255]|uniref:SDR family NAD(P)-dependent oxidoreductase n=1 Tax=Streptomyces sp. NPDC048255 TaxID=3154713 RepID=UPI0033EEC974